MPSTGMAFSNATDLLVRGTTIGYLKLFRLSDGMQTKIIKAHLGISRVDVSLSNTGDTLASGGTNLAGEGEIKIWHLPELSLIATIPAPRHSVLRLSPDGSLLAASNPNTKLVDVYRTSDGTPILSALSARWYVNSVDISPDNKLLAIGVLVNGTSIYSLPSGTLVTNLDTQSTAQVKFTSDGTRLGCQTNGGLYFWNILDWSLVFPRIPGLFSVFDISPNSLTIAVQDFANKVLILNSATGATIKTIDPAQPNQPSNYFQFRTNDELISASNYVGTTNRYDTVRGTVLSTQEDPQEISGQPAFSTDDRWLVSPTRTTKICVGDPRISTAGNRNAVALSFNAELALCRTSEIPGFDILRTSDFSTQSSLPNLSSTLPDPALSPIGDRIIVEGPLVSSSDTVRGISIWSVASNSFLRDIVDPFGYSSPVFSPDGTQIAVGNGNHGNGSYPVRILDAAVGTVIATLSNTVRYPSYQFSPDGKVLLVSGPSSVVHWDLTTQSATPLAAAFTPTAISSKGTIATAGPDNTILFWSSDGKTARGSLAVPDQTGLQTLTFNREGNVLASSHKDGSTWFWCP